VTVPGVFAAFVLLTCATANAGQPDPWFGRDKALHFGASAAIAAGTYWGAALVTDRQSTRLTAATAVALGAGIGKELWDLAGHGNPSWRDLAWDVVGTATGVALAWVIDEFLLHGRTQESGTGAASLQLHPRVSGFPLFTW